MKTVSYLSSVFLLLLFDLFSLMDSFHLYSFCLLRPSYVKYNIPLYSLIFQLIKDYLSSAVDITKWESSLIRQKGEDAKLNPKLSVSLELNPMSLFPAICSLLNFPRLRLGPRLGDAKGSFVIAIEVDFCSPMGVLCLSSSDNHRISP